MIIFFNMKWQLYFGVVWLVVASGFDSDAFEGDVWPCNYNDTINISKGTLNTDGSIMFNKTIYLPSRYAPKVQNGNISTSTRGCLCDQANCIRYCRPDDVPDVGSEIEVINENMKVEKIELHKNFKIVRGVLCDKRILSKYHMTPVSEICNIIFNQQQLIGIENDLLQDGKVVPENRVFSSKRPRTQSEYCLRKMNGNGNDDAEICIQPDALIDPQKLIRIAIGKEFKIILFAKLF